MSAYGYRYFLAFRPPPRLVNAIAAFRDRCLPSSPVSDARLHVTVKGIAMLGAPDPGIATLVDAALNEVDLPACLLAFNYLKSNARVASLEIRGGPDPLVEWRAALSRGAAAVGLSLSYRAPQRSHLTLTYGPGWQGSARIAPIRWMADELVLVESWHGRHVHRVLGRWPLRPALRQGRFAFDTAQPQTQRGLSVS